MNTQAALRETFTIVASATLLSWALYHLPDYFWLEKLTADHSALLLNAVGIPSVSWVLNGKAFLNEFLIERMCTGVQVSAVFAGILLPLRVVNWRKKLMAIGAVAALVYALNIVRIAFEVWLLYSGILPWDLAHYPTGLMLGIFSVAVLLVGIAYLIPEVGDLMSSALSRLVQFRLHDRDDSKPFKVKLEDSSPK